MAKTALHVAARYNLLDDLRRAIADDEDLDEPDGVGFTPLHHACANGRDDAAKILLEAGAEVNAQDQWGATPLSRAVFCCDGTVELVQLLLDHGADPTIENEKGISPLKMAQPSQKTSLIALLEGVLRKDTALDAPG